MFMNFLGACGRALLAVVGGMWTYLLLPILGGVGHGIGQLVRVLLPYVLGLSGLWALITFFPELFTHILAIIIMIAVLWGFWKMVIPGKKKK